MSAPDNLRKIYQIGRTLSWFEFDNIKFYARELMDLSGVCSNCEGSGEDGDDGDAAGVGAWQGDCQACDGTGFRKDASDPA